METMDFFLDLGLERLFDLVRDNDICVGDFFGII